METFGEWVRQQRERRRLTRAELAQRVGCSVAMLRKIEAEERRPSAQIAELLANAFEIPDADRLTFVRVARGELATSRLPVSNTQTLLAAESTGPPSARSNFPISPAPLIGRQSELAQLERLLRDPQCRLLTLVGAGGIGKTRLAGELALQLRDDFEDGICFVPLAAANTIGLLVPVIADALGFRFQGADSEDARRQLFNHLQDKQMLLLLDNLEQLLAEPGIELLTEVLAAAPGLKLLATSREALNLEQEQVFEVRGLPIPSGADVGLIMQDTSFELFWQRARRAHANFDPGNDDYPAIVRICQLVDGIPLAIELAAAWVRTLTCAEIAAELERSLDLLSTSARDVPARHRSMQAVFDHSWKLLSDDEQRALARLSVFRGGFDREAAEQVAGAPLRMLSLLVTKSLVRRTGAGRYDLHELIRQYAAARLEAEASSIAAARRQHYAFYLGLAEAALPHLKGSGQLEWLRRLEEEHDNFRAALEWSLSQRDQGPELQGAEAALRLAGSLRWFWRMRSYYDEGLTWLDRALARSRDTGGPPALRAQATAKVALALLTDSIGDHPTAHARAQESAALFREIDDKAGLAEALLLVGQTLRWQGDAAQGRQRMQEALVLFREVGDRWSTAMALYRLGADLSDFSRDPAGPLMLEESAAILEELGDKFVSVNVHISTGLVAFWLGKYAGARAGFQRALELAREIGDPWGAADALTNIGCVERVQGEYARAESHFQQALKIYVDWGRGGWCADPLCALAENALAQGDLTTARARLGEAMKYAETSGNSWLKVLVDYFRGLLAYYEGDMEQACALLDATAVLARASEYKPDLARTLVSLGRALGAKGDSAKARLSAVEGMRMFSDSGCTLGVATALEILASLAPPHKADQAARLLGTAEAVRAALGTPLPPVDRSDHERDLLVIRGRLGDDAFADAFARGREASCHRVVLEILETFRSTHPEYFVAPPPVAGSPPRPTTVLGSS